jgi:hypothetical protein
MLLDSSLKTVACRSYGGAVHIDSKGARLPRSVPLFTAHCPRDRAFTNSFKRLVLPASTKLSNNEIKLLEIERVLRIWSSEPNNRRVKGLPGSRHCGALNSFHKHYLTQPSQHQQTCHCTTDLAIPNQYQPGQVPYKQAIRAQSAMTRSGHLSASPSTAVAATFCAGHVFKSGSNRI